MNRRHSIAAVCLALSWAAAAAADDPSRISLTFGGEARERFERYTHPDFGSTPEDRDGYLLQRYLVHADVHLGPSFRLFTELESSLENGRAGGPRPSDEDRLDLHQAYVDVSLRPATPGALVLRAGRQELEFGTARLVSARDMLNTRQAFDGVRLLATSGNLTASAYVMRPVAVVRGTFDDGADRGRRAFWGAYLARLGQPGSASAALYYAALDRRAAALASGRADEVRHTIGLRVWGARGITSTGRLDYNEEGSVQTGRFGARQIRAWDLATDTGVSWPDRPLKPRLGLRVDVTSGDRDPKDGTVQTFEAYFPGTAYSGLAGLIGPANAIDLAPSLTLHPLRRLTLTAGEAFFWRYSLRDGLYGLPGNLQRIGTRSRARSIGAQQTAIAAWSVTPHLDLSATVSRFLAGRFLRETPPGEDVLFTSAAVTLRF